MSSLTCADVLAGRAPKDTPVTVKGWVRTRRDSKAGISFVNVSDGSGFHPVQVVAPSTLPNYATKFCASRGCSIEATGIVVPRRKEASHSRCRHAIRVDRLGRRSRIPIRSSPSRTASSSCARSRICARAPNVIGAVTRVRHASRNRSTASFDDNGFFWVNTPIITASDAEGAGELFRVSTLDLANLPRTPEGKIDFSQDFFGREAFLTVSGQLNVETYCMALSKVYTFGPTFARELQHQPHLAEFWMIEPEIASPSLADDATLAEALLKHIFKTVLDERATTWRSSRSASRKGVIAKLQASSIPSSCAWTTPRRSASWKSPKRSSISR
jgi:asparaginyl-tRNA synthetase